MDTAQDERRQQAFDFALRGVAWSLGLFGLLRLSWLETHALLPLTQLQGRLAESGFGAPAMPIDVTLACSGADALALCAGAILAYPSAWRMRLGGAALGIGLILVLNTVRIGTLGRAAGSAAWFEALHVYVWPALLMLAVAGYVFAWMRFADRRRAPAAVSASPPRSGASSASAEELRLGERPTPLTRRFVLSTAVLLVLFTAASPLYLESPEVLAVASLIARAAASALRFLGVQATAAANVLSTARGGFLVTQECIATPLIPVYLAAAFSYTKSWRRRVPALLAAVPLFFGLGIARLLVVALPAALVGSPIFLIHAFYQLLLAGVVVLLAAIWRHGAGRFAWRRALLGGALGGALAFLLESPYTGALTSVFASGTPLEDPQGALALLPAFQVGLYVALCVAAFVALGWRPFVAGLALLGLSQIAVFAALQFVARHDSLTPQVRDVRAWALVGPLLLVAAMVALDGSRRGLSSRQSPAG
jgi:exosortase/archaeosortase family protein